MDDLLSNGLHWKGNDMLIKVDSKYNFLRKSPWSTDGRRVAWLKLLTVFTFKFPFICYLDRICK